MQRESRGLTIRSRLILAGVAPAAAALLIACSAFLASELYFFPREVGVSLGRLAEMIGDNSSAALVFDDRSVTIDCSKIWTPTQPSKRPPSMMPAVRWYPSITVPATRGPFDPPPARETSQQIEADRIRAFHRIALHGEFLGSV